MIVFTPSSMREVGDTAKNDYFEFRVPLHAAITPHASFTGGTAPPRCPSWGNPHCQERPVEDRGGFHSSWEAAPNSFSNSSIVGKLPFSFSGRSLQAGIRKFQSVC
jgi:hypothetical protein